VLGQAAQTFAESGPGDRPKPRRGDGCNHQAQLTHVHQRWLAPDLPSRPIESIFKELNLSPDSREANKWRGSFFSGVGDFKI
jgi:hypothetical protein